eukprot:TRINITY_DN5958_c0_g1_i1.p1 TRINITY_DN5958_c0_g1~~TRINITY_DN5958_c0_g1_i1.p1  ORF type:complete len:165 (-),score=39.41 TRINITY_DN5958_c0_g1_i1:66-560(-)
MSDTKAKLEEYRKRKQAEEGRDAKKNAIWSALTLQPLRQRFTRSVSRPGIQDISDNEENSEDVDGVTPEDEIVEWTRIDWGILAVKILVWVCLQVVFVKIEFGAVFFLFTGIFLMLTNMGKKKAGEMSAYSVFNPNCESIHGTVTAQQLIYGPAAARHGPTDAT